MKGRIRLLIALFLALSLDLSARPTKTRSDHDTFVIGTDGEGLQGKEIVECFVREAFPEKTIEWSNEYKDPDLLVHSYSFQTPYMYSKRTRVPYLVFSGEAKLPPDRVGYAPILRFTSSAPRSERDVYAPQLLHAKYDLPNLRKYPNDPKNERPFLVCYVNSHSVRQRETLFRHLHNLVPDRSHARGTCSQTHPRIEGSWGSDSLFEAYSQYRFVFAMENEVYPGYVTEKIMNAFRSGAVPIFWGDSKTAERFFNPDAYVDVGKFASLKEAAQFIVELDKDEERYRKMAEAPIFRDNQIPSEISFREHFPPEWKGHIEKLRQAYN